MCKVVGQMRSTISFEELCLLWCNLNRVVKCDVTKIEFVKLWDVMRYLEKAL